MDKHYKDKSINKSILHLMHLLILLPAIFNCLLDSNVLASDFSDNSFRLTSQNVLLADNEYTQVKDDSSDITVAKQMERPIRATAGYDCWYTMWSVYVPDPEYTEFHDYNIDPTLIRGLFMSVSSGKQSSNKWGLSVGAYGDYISNREEAATDEKAKYITAMINYGFSEKQILTQFQKAEFKGELVGQYAFYTDWTKIEMSFMPVSMTDDIGQLGGFCLTYLKYTMPLEFTHYEKIGDDNYKDIGHEVISVDTQGISIGFKSLDPMVLGYNNGKLYFYDIDCAFGISHANAKEFEDSVYGFEFNFEIDAGLKHAIKIYDGFMGVKAGYRLFSDNQILSEWKNTDNKSTSGTIRNFFHGPFIAVMGSF